MTVAPGRADRAALAADPDLTAETARRPGVGTADRIATGHEQAVA